MKNVKVNNSVVVDTMSFVEDNMAWCEENGYTNYSIWSNGKNLKITLDTLKCEDLKTKGYRAIVRVIDGVIYTVVKDHLTSRDIKWFEEHNKGYKVVTKDCLLVTKKNGISISYVIFKGSKTKVDMCRDCGTHYEFRMGNTIHKIPYFE